MNARSIPPLLLGAAVVAMLAILVVGRGGGGYHVILQMPNANGLREGSRVESAGIQVGHVATLRTDARDNVIADLVLERGPIGPDATATIKAKNLLGEKVVDLPPGDTRRPQPSGTVLPASRVTESVDLDQVLDVLEPTTRTRLAVLINEAGGAVLGRRTDLNSTLQQLPPSLADATKVLDELVNDNQTLGRLIDRSDRFVAVFSRERSELGRFVDVAGQAAHTVVLRRAHLRRMLASAPGALRNLDQFLAELQTSTRPLGSAARAITASAPELTSTLTALGPFERAAAPTLRSATTVAPQLTALGRQATPVLERANPAVRSLAAFTGATPPVSRTVDVTADDLLAILQGWSRAIQGRDGLSHMFRAKVNFNADSLRTVIKRLVAADRARARARRHASHPARPTPRIDVPSVPLLPKLPAAKLPQIKVGPVPRLSELPRVKLPPQIKGPARQTTDSARRLLDFLLGR